MATNQVCDVCNIPNKPVYVVRVTIEVTHAVEGSESTGCAHEIEACEGCWPKAMADLHANVFAQLTRDIPVHRQVYEKNAQIADKTVQLVKKVRLRDSITVTSSPEYTAAVNEVNVLVGEIQQLEDDRAALLAPKE